MNPYEIAKPAPNRLLDADWLVNNREKLDLELIELEGVWPKMPTVFLKDGGHVGLMFDIVFSENGHSFVVMAIDRSIAVTHRPFDGDLQEKEEYIARAIRLLRQGNVIIDQSVHEMRG